MSTVTTAGTATSSDARRSLVLGLLAIPGSTVAWDLPAGGLWIGLPLAIAALLYGRRARTQGAGGRQAVAGMVLGALCILQMAVWAAVPGRAAAAEAQTIRLDARLTSFHKQDTAPKGDSAGDRLQFTDKLSRAGARVGHDAATCEHTSRRYYECDWTVSLRDGTLQANGLAFDTNAGYTLTITGGTGRYAGARGTMRVTDALRSVAHYRLRYRLG